MTNSRKFRRSSSEVSASVQAERLCGAKRKPKVQLLLLLALLAANTNVVLGRPETLMDPGELRASGEERRVQVANSSLGGQLSEATVGNREVSSRLEDRRVESKQNGLNLTQTNQLISTTQTPQAPQQTSKPIPVLRPSIEEVASELSKKHLNLEHENWRLKQSNLVDTTTSGGGGGGGERAAASAAAGRGGSMGGSGLFDPQLPTSLIVESERDIGLPELRLNLSVKDANEAQRFQLERESFLDRIHDRNRDQYLHIETTSASSAGAAASASAAAAAGRPVKSNATKQPVRGRKLIHHQQQQQQANGNFAADNELSQCHQYLNLHGSPDQNHLASGNHLMRSLAGQQLPCSCEYRRHFTLAEIGVWLNCNGVQLIGSHFYKTPPSSRKQKVNNTNESNGQRAAPGGENGAGQSETDGPGKMLIRFSQRDSGLQVLHSQKFHYLQLNHLSSIDLSSNRIRQIKLDAFHGLERRLEYLDLSDNLLGDFRATNFQEERGLHNIGRLIFHSDELSRLMKLKWLSLRNNQISQLGSGAFIRQQVAPNGKLQKFNENELKFLDLSGNLLNLVPSSSIENLKKLEILNLNRNRIEKLDQFSKFPKSLRSLDLSENLIKTIRQCDLIELPNLMELNLSFNQLNNLDQSAFISTQSVSTSSSSLLNNLMMQGIKADIMVAPAHLSKLNGDKPALDGTDQSSLNQISARAQVNSEANQRANGNERKRRSADLAIETREERQNQVQATDNNSDSNHDRAANDEGGSFVDDLDADEATQIGQVSQVGGQTMNEELSQPAQFNSTVKLNLSHNLFEQIPGDSLVKFSNLQQLDLSYNRIRSLDSNYLCSIYNLVDNLRLLDLSGNLLSIGQDRQQQSDTTAKYAIRRNTRHLNRLFGCLQKLEKLHLSTNRLAGSWRPDVGELKLAPVVAPLIDEHDDLAADGSEETQVRGSTLQHHEPDDRLVIKFGDGFGSRYLNSLDLSDNQLRSMPIIEQVTNQPIVLTNNNITTSYQSQLNQWMSSRFYLEVLNLNNNYLARLDEHDFEYLFNLRELHLDFNRLTSLPSRLMRRFTSLDRLSLEGNRITELEPLNQVLERSIRTLRVLNLANNRLLVWPQIDRPSELASTLQRNDEQGSSIPDFDNNNGKHLQFSLEELNLEGNLLTSSNVSSLFDQLSYMKSLKTLNLSFNLLNRIKSEWFKFANLNLKRLYLNGNKINNIDLGSFATNQVNELIELNLESNLLKELKRKTFDSMPKIKELNLAFNLIHTINSETFHQVNSLQVLKLNNNKLTSWKCEYFSNLCNSISGQINADLATLINSNLQSPPATHQSSSNIENGTLSPAAVSSLIELDLSHNSISQLRANSISVHTKLVKLNLEFNKLSFIPHDLFRATTSGLSSSGRQIQLVSAIRYLNLAHNRIQTIDNINFKPMRNLLSLDLSFNELQTLGLDVVLIDSKSIQQERNNRQVIISNNLTSLFLDEDEAATMNQNETGQYLPPAISTSWPSLSKLRHLSVANNQLTMINQSLLSELSPFALLNLNLSSNYLESEGLPYGFYSKVSSAGRQAAGMQSQGKDTKYDLVFTLKLESLDLSHNRLSEFPVNLLDNHYTSMDSCNLSHNRIQSLTANSNMLIQIKSFNIQFNPLNRESSDLILFEQRSVRHLNLAATRLYAIQQATSEQPAQSPNNLSPPQASGKRRSGANQTAIQLDQIRSINKPIDAPFLRHLNLSSNQLVWLAINVFDRTHSLETLDLSNNQLTRLNLLNTQLTNVALSLKYLDLSSNSFTSVGQSDLNQLFKLQHLDLSNLLSLQRFNCKFLAKLQALKTLKLFNYPLLRQNLQGLLNSLLSNGHLSERMLRKMGDELVVSSIGQHCFRLSPQQPQTSLEWPETEDSGGAAASSVWLDVQHMELELFNDFASPTQINASRGFQLGDELSRLLGPSTRRLSLMGLNLTSMGDESLLGITGDKLELRISYTSMAQLPLRQILTSLAKRTKLNLDFRHNNMGSISTSSLQLLDELQLNNQLLQRGDHSSLRLSFNPVRCDCQTRPLWLWLNKRWASVELPAAQAGEDQLVDTSTSNIANYWLKFNTVSQTSDLKCHYPLKLRGKLTQHVHYNDLVCKGSPTQSPAGNGRQSKRRNETRLGESYHLPADGSINELDELDEEESESDYFEFEPKSEVAFVKLTRFNRYPSNSNNQSLHSSNAVSFGSAQDSTQDDHLADNGARMSKRDQNSVNSPASNSRQMWTGIGEPRGQQVASTAYSKHRPNTHQRHSHFNTLNAFNQLPQLGRTIQQSRDSSHGPKRSLLTDLDVLILTVITVAMTVMSFIIIGVCLFKYKMDRSDREKILSSQGKLLLSQGLLLDGNKMLAREGYLGRAKGSSKQSSSPKSSSSKHSKRTTGKECSRSSPNAVRSGKQETFGPMVARIAHQQYQTPKVLVPMNHVNPILAPQTQNFLMRSPTIRRMHGLASNASDWFKFTLRAYPSTDPRRRRLFNIGQVGSQLTTSQLVPVMKPIGSETLIATGCPLHAFRCVRRFKEMEHHVGQIVEERCSYCAQLLAALQQTKVQHLSKSQARDGYGGAMSKLGTTNAKQGATSAQEPILLQGEQQERFNMQPNLLRVLAKQIEIQQRTNHETGGETSGSCKQNDQWIRGQNYPQPTSYSREQHIKPMRTFGANVRPQYHASTDTVIQKLEVQSEIPTVDVDGRFAYQSESQGESPAFDRRDAEKCEDSAPDSNNANPNDALMSQNSSRIANLTDSGKNGGSSRISTGRQLRATSDDAGQTGEASSIMNDECSRSSSPIAYGFMRSSPSTTTLSSATVTQSNYVVNPKVDYGAAQIGSPNFVLDHDHEFGLYRTKNGNQTESRAYSCNNNNNNDPDYPVSRKEETMGPVAEADGGRAIGETSSAPPDDPVIISRL